MVKKYRSVDVETAVAEYRRVLDRVQAAATTEERATQQAIADRLRNDWKMFGGRGDLHELALGSEAPRHQVNGSGTDRG